MGMCLNDAINQYMLCLFVFCTSFSTLVQYNIPHRSGRSRCHLISADVIFTSWFPSNSNRQSLIKLPLAAPNESLKDRVKTKQYLESCPTAMVSQAKISSHLHANKSQWEFTAKSTQNQPCDVNDSWHDLKITLTSKMPCWRPIRPLTPASSMASLMAALRGSSWGSIPPPGTTQQSGRRWLVTNKIWWQTHSNNTKYFTRPG